MFGIHDTILSSTHCRSRSERSLAKTISTAALALAVMVLATAPATQAAEASHPCARIAEAPERLACYDRAFPLPPEAAASAALAATQRFGTPARPLTATPEPERISARVLRSERSTSGDRVFVLDNGQQWRQVERGMPVHVADGEAVEIERAVLGGFRLVTAAGVGLRVRRLR